MMEKLKKHTYVEFDMRAKLERQTDELNKVFSQKTN